ncbi:MAG: hypothetical protein QCH31_00570 [Methanolobus sp.]|nr:hypothetical protein [Methanolobus sp.]
MKYIRFVIIFICLLFMCAFPGAGVSTETMVHYSEPSVTIKDELFLEQGYSVRIVDVSSNTGEMLIDVYLHGKPVKIENNLAKKDVPLEYIRSVVTDNEKEKDYLILRITPKGSVKRSGGDFYSTVYIEQYLDPVEDVGHYFLLDKSYSLKSGYELDLAGLYTLETGGVDDETVSLRLKYDGKLLKEDEVGYEDYFYYTVYSENGPRTIFLANVKAFFQSDDSTTVFLKHVSLRQEQISEIGAGSGDAVDIEVISPVEGGLKAGHVAIISYILNVPSPEVKVLIDGEIIDSRKYVHPGTYKAVTGELDAGIHNVTLMMLDNDGHFSYYSREFSVSSNIRNNITGSIMGIASSATGSIGEENSSSNKSSVLSLQSLPLTSNISNIISLVVTAGVFFVFFVFLKKFK